MKKQYLIFCIILLGCQKSENDLVNESYNSLSQKPVSNLFTGVTAYVRGNVYTVYLENSKFLGFVENGKIKITENKLPIIKQEKIIKIAKFMEEEHLLTVNGSFIEWNRLEFRIDDSIILVYSENIVHYDWLEKEKISSKRLDKNWYYYKKNLN